MNIALFDFDGTITSKDCYTAFIHFAVGRRRLAFMKILLAPILAGYKLKIISGNVIRTIASFAVFKGYSRDALEAKGLQFAETFIQKSLRKEALDRIAWHKKRGDEVVVVSASLDLYLKPWCEKHDLKLICTQMETSAGILTGRYVSGDCSYQRKAERVQKEYQLDSYPEIYAYGDTVEDFPLLELAKHKYFRWKPIASIDEISPKIVATSSFVENL